MSYFINRIIYFCLSLLIIIAISEILLRYSLTPRYFDVVEASIEKQEKIDFIFLGYSRTAASVNTEVFMKYFNGANKNHGKVFNLANGSISVPEYYLGLKKIFKSYPDKLKGAKIFIEAPGLVLEPFDWEKDTWGNPKARGPLTEVLLWEDIPGLFKSHTSDKAYVFAEFCNPFKIWDKRIYIREMIVKWRLDNNLKNYFSNTTDKNEKLLTNKGGIRTDKEGILLNRKMVIETTTSRIHREMGAWDKSIVQDIINLIRKNNCDIVFFQAAESSLYYESYKDSIHQLNQKKFKMYLDRNKVILVAPKCRFPDEDFPDLSHLSDAKSPFFTNCLIDEYLKEIKNTNEILSN